MRVRAALTIACVALAAPPAWAGPGDAKTAARALAEQGHALYEAGKHEQALSTFEQAERTFHAPTLLLAIARTQAAMRRLVDARATLQRVIDEKLAPDAPHAFRDAQRSAREEAAALDKRIPTVRIAVRGGGGRPLRLSVDGAAIEGWQPDRELRLDPGAHQIAVTPTSGAGAGRSVDLPEGARAFVELTVPDAAPPAPIAPSIAPSTPPAAPRPWLAPAVASFGVGAVGLGLAAGAGAATLSKAAALKERCPTGTCPFTTQNQKDVSAANALGTASTIGVVLAGAGVAAGVVLLMVKPGGKRDTALTIGPGSIGARGVF